MAKTDFQDIGFIQDDIDIYETGGTYDDIDFGDAVWLSSGEARKITDVDAPQVAVGLSAVRKATGVEQLDWPDDKIAIVLFPCKVVTDNVDSTNPPEAGARVYLLDDGSWSDTDTGTSGVYYGTCTKVYADGKCFLNLHNAMDVNTTE